MRILWITRQDPRAANSGELIHTLGLLRALAETGAVRTTVLAHQGGPASYDIPRTFFHLPRPIGRKSPLSLVSPLPSDAHRLGGSEMRLTLADLLRNERFDRAVIDQAAAGWAIDALPAELPVLYIAHNHEAVVRAEVAADASGLMAPLIRIDAGKYARLENRIARRSRWIAAITPRDAEAFRKDFPDKRYLVLSPGFDGPIPESAPAPITSSTPRQVVLAGTFGWIAKRRNLEAFLRDAEACFPAAGIGFTVVGLADPGYFADLARRHPWAKFHANVPSVDPYLRAARIGLIPEALGGGFKLKALDYIFRGLPLASIESALSGLPLDPGVETLSATDTASLAREVAAHIDDFDFLNRAAAGALDRCRHAFRWQDRGSALAAALAEPD
ncbi:MAG: glycosyltransferase [Akkermansiaceae bacterium]|jgi:glycosyltransferase involved in cell wall biosynthesis|nr:glycosyltransferase [Akkermansiaceae bacterium]